MLHKAVCVLHKYKSICDTERYTLYIKQQIDLATSGALKVQRPLEAFPVY